MGKLLHQGALGG